MDNAEMNLAKAICIRKSPFGKEVAVDKVELKLAQASCKTLCIRKNLLMKR